MPNGGIYCKIPNKEPACRARMRMQLAALLPPITPELIGTKSPTSKAPAYHPPTYCYYL